MTPLKVSLITPTGARHQAFALCEQWIRNQESIAPHKLKEWIVVDDYPKDPTKCTMNQVYIRGPKQWEPGINTQRYNMDVALERVSGDVIFIIEDDEYYSPEYFKLMLHLLEASSVAGLSNSRYYHLGYQGFKVMKNFQHASLCHTAVKAPAFKILYEAVHSGEYYFDLNLWEKAQEQGLGCALLSNTNLSIGIKGMPGRAGLGAGHEAVGYKSDRDLSTLRSWIGKDIEYYRSFLKK